MTVTAPARADAAAPSPSANEGIKIEGRQSIDRIRRLLHEGHVRRISIKQGEHAVVAFPLTVGVVGTILAPGLAAVGTLAALIAGCTISLERIDRPAPVPIQEGARQGFAVNERQEARLRMVTRGAGDTDDPPVASIVDGVRGPDDLDPIFIPERLRARVT